MSIANHATLETLQRRHDRARMAFNVANSEIHCFIRECRTARLRHDYLALYRARQGYEGARERCREAEAELAEIDAEFAALTARAVA